MFLYLVPEATTEKIVIDPCNPDPCGRYAFCKNQNGYAACMCEAGYFGSPPNCRPECTINADCASSLACIGQKCKILVLEFVAKMQSVMSKTITQFASAWLATLEIHSHIVSKLDTL